MCFLRYHCNNFPLVSCDYYICYVDLLFGEKGDRRYDSDITEILFWEGGGTKGGVEEPVFQHWVETF